MSVFVPIFFGGVLFNECIIKYNRTSREFTLNASVGTLNFLLTVFIGLMALCLIVLGVSVGLSTEDLFALLPISIAILAPYVSTYFRETKLLSNIGSTAMEQR
jgi:hypothetical protein